MPVFDLLAGTPDGVFAVDRRQRIAFWNDGARRILGFEPDAVRGKFCYEILAGIDERGCAHCEKDCATFRGSLRGRLSPTRATLFRTSDGGRKPVSVTTFVLPSNVHERSLLAHVFRDASLACDVRLPPERQASDAGVGADRSASPAPLDALTPREAEILELLAAGRSTLSICAGLRISPTTFRTHVQHILAKLGVHSRLEAVASGVRSGLLRVDFD